MAYSIQRIHATDVISVEQSLKKSLVLPRDQTSVQRSSVDGFPTSAGQLEIQDHLGWALVDLEQLVLFRSELTSLNAVCLSWRSP